jgi:ADP-L-glycero-D-manno-heptose 6-epimerase
VARVSFHLRLFAYNFYRASLYGGSLWSTRMRVLVTGGAGFIGSGLARRLETDGHAVTVLDDFSSGHFRNLVSFTGDVLTNHCESPPAHPHDFIFHEASITDTTVTDQWHMMRNNVEAFRHVLHWAADWHCPVVWASSAAVYGNRAAPMRETDAPDPLNVYGYSKLAMERLAAAWHTETRLPITGLRYFNVYGPGEWHKGKFASMIFQLAQQMRAGGRPRVFTDGSQRRDFVWVGDVIEANMLAMAAGQTGIFNVGSGGSQSFNDVIAALNAVLGMHTKPEYFENPYAFFQNHTEADISAARGRLGYAPKCSLIDGVRLYCQAGL